MKSWFPLQPDFQVQQSYLRMFDKKIRLYRLDSKIHIYHAGKSDGKLSPRIAL